LIQYTLASQSIVWLNAELVLSGHSIQDGDCPTFGYLVGFRTPAGIGWLDRNGVLSSQVGGLQWSKSTERCDSMTWKPSHTDQKEQMTKFFQHLDILATHAGYITNDNYMIGFPRTKDPSILH